MMKVQLKPNELALLQTLSKNNDDDMKWYSSFDSAILEALKCLLEFELVDIETNKYTNPSEVYCINENGLRFLRNFIAVEWR